MRRLLPATACVLALAGCGSSSGGAPAAQAPASSSPSPVQAVNRLPSCAPAPTVSYRWPSPVPADLPRLPGATIGKTQQTADGLTIVRFTTATSLRDGVLFIVKQLPPAGYVLGRGDAEATEADAPFNKGELRGVLRGISREVCSTEWLLAVTRRSASGSGTPLLPTRPRVSPSPLPFGN